MRPLLVIVLEPASRYAVEMAGAEEDKVIEHLPADRAQEPLDKGLAVRRALGTADAFDVMPLQNSVEFVMELRVLVMLNEAHFQAGASSLLRKGPCLLEDPDFFGMQSRRREDHSPSLNVQEHEEVGIPNPLPRKHLLSQEVSLPQGVSVPLEELIPGAASPLRTRLQPLGLEDVPDRRLADRVDAELLEFPDDSGIAPVVLFSHADDELADLFVGTPSSPASLGSLLFLSDPAQESSWGHDRHQLIKGLTELGAELHQTLPLVLGDRDPGGQLASEDFVLDFQVTDLPRQLFLRGAGDDEHQRAVDREHGRKGLWLKETTSFLHHTGALDLASDHDSSGNARAVGKWCFDATACN